jgi:hypothetical protein
MNLEPAVGRSLRIGAICLVAFVSVAMPWAAAGATGPAPGSLGRVAAIEQAIETSAASVSLPASATGALLVTPCRGCAPVSLQAMPRSEWRLGARATNFAAVRAAVVSTPGAQVLVVYRSRSLELVRLVAYVR